MICNIDGRKTHSVVHSALQIVEKLDHRAGKDASGKVGDGVGILLQISHTFFSHIVDFPLPSARQYGVGMFFLPNDYLKKNQAKRIFSTIAKSHGCQVLGYRKVDCNPEILGKKALDCMPANLINFCMSFEENLRKVHQIPMFVPFLVEQSFIKECS